MIYPLVYIIIVNYKGLNDTLECLMSLKLLKYNNFRIAILDNNVLDFEARQLSLKFGDWIDVIWNGKNLGFSGANNIGIRYVLKKGAEYVLLLNNDTVVSEDFLLKLLLTAINNEKAGIAVPKINFYLPKNKVWYGGGKIFFLTGDAGHIGYNEENLLLKETETDFATGCCMLIKKEVFSKIGFFNENYFMYYEDTDFCLRARKKGFKIFLSPNSLIWHKEKSANGAFLDKKYYYLTRNKLYCIQNSFSLPHKIALLATLPASWIKNYFKNFLAGNYSTNKYFCLAIKDFCLKKVGKLNEK